MTPHKRQARIYKTLVGRTPPVVLLDNRSWMLLRSKSTSPQSYLTNNANGDLRRVMGPALLIRFFDRMKKVQWKVH
jgi:hypothetical protein